MNSFQYEIGLKVNIKIPDNEINNSYLTRQLGRIDPNVSFEITDHNEVITYFDPNGVRSIRDTTKDQKVILKTEFNNLPQDIGFSVDSIPSYKYIYVPVYLLEPDLTDPKTDSFIRKNIIEQKYSELTSEHVLSSHFSSFSTLQNEVVQECLDQKKELDINTILKHLVQKGQKSFNFNFLRRRRISFVNNTKTSEIITKNKEYNEKLNDYINFTFLNKNRYIKCVFPKYIYDGTQKLLTKISKYSTKTKSVEYISEPIIIHSNGIIYYHGRAVIKIKLGKEISEHIRYFDGYPNEYTRPERFPHVFYGGHMCYGSLTIKKDISSKNIYDYLKITAQGLYNYNPKSPVQTPESIRSEKVNDFLGRKTKRSLIYPEEGVLDTETFNKLNIAMWQADCQQYDISSCNKGSVLELIENHKTDYKDLEESKRFEILPYEEEEALLLNRRERLLPFPADIPISRFVFDNQNYYKYQENKFAYICLNSDSIVFVLKHPIEYAITSNRSAKITDFKILINHHISVKPKLISNATLSETSRNYFHPLVFEDKLILPYSVRVKVVNLMANMKLHHITTLIIDALNSPEKYSSHIEFYDEIVQTKFPKSNFERKS